MNNPNRLTMLRMALVPVFVMFLLLPVIPFHYLWAAIVFIFASITDAIDGHLARKHDLVSNFGKFMDPLADKVLVVSALICFVKLGLSEIIVILIIVAREFMITSLRTIAAERGTVIAASKFAKLKTITQMVAIITILVLQAFIEIFGLIPPQAAYWMGQVLLWICGIFTIASGIGYLLNNKQSLSSS